MAKTNKELAFIRDLFVDEAWTLRFTDLVDKHIKLLDAENLAYLNAGTGNHAMALADKFGEVTDVFAQVETEDLLTIARDKAAATSSRADFSRVRFEDDSFDSVLADASLVPISEISQVIEDAIRVAKVGGDIGIMLPTAGSYGEVFSLLWEALINEDLADHGAHIETLIAELPSVTRAEELAKREGLVNVHSEVAVEFFEYESGTEFVESPLVADYLMPHWLAPLDENEKERVVKQLTHLIDAEEAPLTFRFSVKATLLSGEKG